MRLLFLTNVLPSPLFPGKGTFNQGLLDALAAIGHEAQAVVPIPFTAWLKASRATRRAMQSGVEGVGGIAARYPVYFYTPGVFRTAYGAFMWRGIRSAVQSALADFRPQAVVAYWAHPDGYCAIRATQLAGVPAIVMVGGSDLLLLTSSASRRRAIYDVLTEADAVVAVSEDLRQNIVANGIARERVHVVRRGIDTRRFRPGERAEARQRLGLPHAEKILLWVGRMEPVKGLPVLIEAMRVLKADGIKATVLLVGSGAQADEIARQASRCGVEDCVQFVGSVPHASLADYYRAADLTVLPSLSEGVPNVLLESMACGTPFVATAVGGIPEIVSPEHDRLVPPGDAAALAAAIRERLAVPAPNSERVFMPEDWPTAASRLIDVIEPLLKKTERAKPVAQKPCLAPSTV